MYSKFLLFEYTDMGWSIEQRKYLSSIKESHLSNFTDNWKGANCIWCTLFVDNIFPVEPEIH